jgi:endo-1,4-beta-mannosidase
METTDATGHTMPFLLGINYWPRKKAMFWWKRFDTGEVESEFAEIAAWGLDIVRIFLMWEDFQPAPFTLNHEALADLGTVLDVAHATGLRVTPTFFVGHMSGINWAPTWVLNGPAMPGMIPVWAGGVPVDRRPGDIYADPPLLRAQLFQLRAVVGRYALHPAIHAWCLTNENDNFLRPHDVDAAWLWNLLLSREVRHIDPVHPVTAGLHIEDYDRYRGFRPADLAEGDTFLAIHAYSLYTTWARTRLDPAVVAFSVALARALGHAPVMAEEFGINTSPDGKDSYMRTMHLGQRSWQQLFASDDQAATYYRQVGDGLLRVGAIGALAWCFSDYDPSLYDTPPFNTMVHERYFGLTRYDGTEKPALSEFRRLKGTTVATTPDIVVEVPDDYYGAPEDNFHHLFEQFAVAFPAPQP